MTNQTDRELIQYLVNELQGYRVAHPDHEMPALEAGRTRLAQPEPQGPTDEELTNQEIEEWADAAAEVPLEELDPEVYGWRRCFSSEEFCETIRDAIARWGRPAIKPVPVAERPWEREGWCDAEGRCWFGAPPDGAADAGWILRKPSERLSHQTVSLPHWALPVPTAP